MKKLLSIFILLSIFSFVSFSQGYGLRAKGYQTIRNINQGEYIQFAGNAVDSLCVSDSAFYIFPVTHINQIAPYMQLYWNKRLSGTATITISFYQANNLPTTLTSSEWVTVKQKYTNAAFTKALTCSATGWQVFWDKADSAILEGRYLKIQMVTSSTSTVSGKITCRAKFNIK
jgi:hypothetical protein